MTNTAKKIITGICATTCVLAAASSCSLFSKKEVVVAPLQGFPTITIRVDSAIVNTDFPAEVEARNVVEVCSRAMGYLSSILVSEGNLVKKGQTIVKINDADYVQKVNAASAAVKSAAANVNNARLEVEKITPLVEKNIVSPFQLETAKSNLMAAEANLAQANSQLSDARINLSYTTITSPVTGVIGKMDIRPGSLIQPGTLISTVSAEGDVFAYFAFDEKKLLSMLGESEGSNIYEKVKELPAVEFILADGSIYPELGQVEVASGIINKNTGSIQLKGVFKNPTTTMRSGSTGKVRIPVKYKNVFIVPQKATYELQDRKMVYVYNPADSTVKSKAITVIANTNTDFVVSSGVNSGDVIVYEGISRVRDGMQIAPENVQQ